MGRLTRTTLVSHHQVPMARCFGDLDPLAMHIQGRPEPHSRDGWDPATVRRCLIQSNGCSAPSADGMYSAIVG